MRRSRSAAALAFVGGLTLLAGCTTIPATSIPSVVRPIESAVAPVTSPSPPPQDADPRAIVSYFLDGNANVNDTNHAAATSVLAPKTIWVQSPVTVVKTVQIGNPYGRGNTRRVIVSGQQLGQVDQTGIYHPVLSGDGSGAGSTPYSEAFVLTQVAVKGGGTSARKQWRISEAPKGIVLSLDQFAGYRQRALYYFDSTFPASGARLVPQPRYSPLLDPSDLAQWLLAGLESDPGNGGLQSVLPQLDDPSKIQVTFPTTSNALGAPVRIEIPTSQGLGPEARNGLAAQLAATLAQISSINSLEITDGGKAVRIPAVSGTVFTPSEPDLVDRYQLQAPTAKLFYLRGGSVYAEPTTVLPLRTQNYSPSSLALSPNAANDGYDVAAVYGTGNVRKFAIGRQDTQLKLVPKVTGALTRPSWEPDGSSAWVGSGADLWRVSPSGAAVRATYELAGGRLTVSAVRISPDGRRIALVLSSSDGTSSQVYVGTVEDGARPSIVNLEPITPKGVLVRDVSWYDQLKLFVVGNTPSAFVFYEVQSDGSAWTMRPTLGLPGAPDSLTVADGALAVVSTGGTLWRQTEQGDGWEQLRTGATQGTNPFYIE